MVAGKVVRDGGSDQRLDDFWVSFAITHTRRVRKKERRRDRSILGGWVLARAS